MGWGMDECGRDGDGRGGWSEECVAGCESLEGGGWEGGEMGAYSCDGGEGREEEWREEEEEEEEGERKRKRKGETSREERRINKKNHGDEARDYIWGFFYLILSVSNVGIWRRTIPWKKGISEEPLIEGYIISTPQPYGG